MIGLGLGLGLSAQEQSGSTGGSVDNLLLEDGTNLLLEDATPSVLILDP